MRTHELKTWPEFYEQVYLGNKTVEVRKDDRDFEVGDVLHLREYVPGSGAHYTGRECRRYVSHVLRGWGVEPGYVALSIWGDS